MGNIFFGPPRILHWSVLFEKVHSISFISITLYCTVPFCQEFFIIYPIKYFSLAMCDLTHLLAVKSPLLYTWPSTSMRGKGVLPISMTCYRSYINVIHKIYVCCLGWMSVTSWWRCSTWRAAPTSPSATCPGPGPLWWPPRLWPTKHMFHPVYRYSQHSTPPPTQTGDRY